MLSLLSSILATTSWWELGAVAALVYAVHKIIQFEVQSPLAKIPGPRPSFFSITFFTLKQIITEDVNMFLDVHEKYGTVVRVGPNTVWVSSAAGIRKLFGSHMYAKASTYDAFQVGGDNLFSTRDIEYHRVQKRLMLPGYTPVALNQLEPLISRVGVESLVARLTKHAKAGETVDLMDLLQRMTFDVIGEIGFGKSFDLLADDKEQHPIMQWMVVAGIDGVMKILLGPLYHPMLFPNNAHSLDSLLKFAREIIKKRRANGGKGCNDTLQKMMDAVDEETGATMSDEQLVAQSIMLMIAGTDTTAATLTWTMHLLIENPKYARKLYDEIKTVYLDNSTPISHDDIQSLPYLDAVLHESMRIRPIAAHGMTRLIPEGGTTIDGHYLPAGTNTIVSIISLHHTESVFPNPKVFNPERWITTPEKLAEMKQHWVAFSVGPRSCIGRNLAWMELRLTLVELMRRFTFTPTDDNDMEPIYMFILRPKGNKFMVKPHLI